jgi:hypothetical protein
MANEAVPSLIDKYRTSLIVVVSVLVGVVLLVFAYFTDQKQPFVSFLLLQFGGLLIFSAGYAALSDYFVRKNFERQVHDAIDFVRLDQSIKDAGLRRISAEFNNSELVNSIMESSSVLMLVLRSDGFFTGNYDQLMERLRDKRLNLAVMLPDPRNQSLMTLMSAKFSDYSKAADLAESIKRVINVWLIQEMYGKLAPQCRSQIQLYLVSKYPLYSAYVFDHREMWYIPYHHRSNHQRIPTFVFGKTFESTEVYKDLEALRAESLAWDLSQELVLPVFPS